MNHIIILERPNAALLPPMLKHAPGPYVLLKENDIVANFNSALSARLYAQGMACNRIVEDPAQLRIYSKIDRKFILIGHLLQFGT